MLLRDLHISFNLFTCTFFSYLNGGNLKTRACTQLTKSSFREICRRIETTVTGSMFNDAPALGPFFFLVKYLNVNSDKTLILVVGL